MDGLAGIAAEVQSGVHGGNVQERIEARPERGTDVDLAGHRLADRHPQKRVREMLGLRPRDLYPRDRALKIVAFARQLDGNEGAAAGGRRRSAKLEAKLGEHAVQSPCLALITLLQLRKAQSLPMIQPVE